MSSHAKEITSLKDSIPKLLFLTTGKLTKQFEDTNAFVTRAHLEFDVDEQTFTFDFATEDNVHIKTNFEILKDGEVQIGVNGIHDPLGPPINDTIN